MTTQPSTYAYESQLPAAALNASFDGKADLDPQTGLLDVRELPTVVTTAMAQAAAAVPTATVGQPGGPAGPLAAGGTLPLAQVGLKAGTGITIAGDGTIASSGGGGGGGAAGATASPFAPPTVAQFTTGWLGQQAHAVGPLTNSTVTDDPKAGLRFLFAPCSQDQNQLRGLLIPAPAAPYELVAHVRMPSPLLLEYVAYGIGWCVSSTRSCDVISYAVTQTNNVQNPLLSRLCWTVTGPGDNACSVTSGAATPEIPALTAADMWFRIVDDGTNRLMYFGTESVNGPWHLLYSMPRADPSGLNAVPDTLGVFCSVIEMGSNPPGIGLPLIVDNWTLRGLTDDPIY